MKILIIGLGSIAKKHIFALRQLESDCEIYALRSSKESKHYDGINNLYSLKDNTFFFDFAIISNPTSEHARAIEELLKYNIPLFIEKPVFANLDRVDIIQKVLDKNILTYVGCNMRFTSCIKYMKDFLDNNKKRLNEVNVYCGSYLPEWRPGSDFRKCYSAIPELGGGVHLDLIHEIDYLYWFFGKPKKSFSILRNKSSLNIKAIDYANYNLIYDDFCVNIVLNYFRRDAERYIELVFEDSTWKVDLLRNKITDNENNVIFYSSQTDIDTYIDQMSYFISLVRENIKKSFNTISEGFDVLKICLNNERFE